MDGCIDGWKKIKNVLGRGDSGLRQNPQNKVHLVDLVLTGVPGAAKLNDR